MSKAKSVALGLCFLFGLSGTAFAAKGDGYFGMEQYGEVGPYQITKQSDPNTGDFDFCFSERQVGSGVSITFQIDQTGFLSLVVGQRFRWDHAVSLQGTIKFDGREFELYDGIRIENDSPYRIVYPIGEPDDFLREIARSKEMVVSWEKKRITVPLARMSEAIRETRNCLKEAKGSR